jgi:hypothetical protein
MATRQMNLLPPVAKASKRRLSFRYNVNKNERNEEVEVFMRETMSEGAVKRRWLENDHVRVKGAWNRNRRSMTVAWLLERS